MQRRHVVEHGGAQLVDDLAARHHGRREGETVDTVIGVDLHAIGAGADIAPCAADDEQAEMFVATIFRRRCRRARARGAAIGAVGLERSFGIRITDLGKGAPGGAVIRRVLHRTGFAAPAGKFIRIEMAVARIGQVRDRPVSEFKQRAVDPLGRPGRIVIARRCIHRLDHAAAEQTGNINLMCGLAEHHTAAQRGIEFFGPARTVDEIGIVHRVDQPRRTVIAGLDQTARFENRRVITMAVTDQQVNPGRRRGVDHACAVFDGQRHRLFDQNVFSRPCRNFSVFGMKLVRCRNVDRVDISLAAHRLDAVIGSPAEIGLEPHPGRWPCIDRRHDIQPRMQRERRQHHGKSATETGNTEFQISANRGYCRRGSQCFCHSAMLESAGLQSKLLDKFVQTS